MEHLRPYAHTRRVGPTQVSRNKKDKGVDDLRPRKNNSDDEKKNAEKEAETRRRRRRRRRRILYSLLCCTAGLLAILGGILLAYLFTIRGVSCTPSCMNNGMCTANNVCQCPSGYNGSYCATPICSQPCINGNCTAPNFCTCPSGYYGSTCSTPSCSSNCVNGTCSAPNTCTCQTGWSGATCSTPICASACVYGNCSSPNICTCNSGWNGSTCNSPICSTPCQNNGTCIGPNTCSCVSGYNGSLCQFPICSIPCQNNGTCTAPNTCTCLGGYNGSVCQYPICNVSCLNGGVCIAPNTCQCIPDVWTGPICQTPIRILWSFDNNLQDLYNNFPGVAVNGPTYNSPGINGYGTCLYLNASAFQSLIIPSPPFLNMAQTSFSLLTWAKATTLNNAGVNGYASDNAVFGQFQNFAVDQALHIIVRNQKIYLGFYNDDISGTVTLYPGNWYHMAYVYDYSTFTQYVYINGILDVSGSPKGPYQGTTGDLTIGTNAVLYPYNYWDGCLDQVAYFAEAKNATEVLREATLTVDYSFDNSTLLDSGPLGINGTGINYAYSSAGRINQSLSLLTNPSYVQATGLVLLGTPGQSYSLSIWINPTVTSGATIIHVSALSTGLGWCVPMLGFTSAGAIGVQGWNGSSVSLTGPIATANVWTHLAVTYSSSNGICLWINGTQYGPTSGPFSYAAANVPVTATLGSSLNAIGCSGSGVITMGQYYGYMDEFQLYSRELSAADVLSLANP